MKTRWIVTALAVSGLAIGAQAQNIELLNGATPPPTSGEAMYKTYCASCHGDDAKGMGGTSALLANKPADLTALSLTHSQGFPRRHVLATIRRGHAGSPTTTPMPDWGTIFRLVVDPKHPELAEMRAIALTDYVESIQQP